MPIFKGNDLIRDTDYTVADMNLLISSGAMPMEFITFCQNGTTVVSPFVIHVMKVFPKARCGDDWLQYLGSVLHHWVRRRKESGEPIEPEPTPPKKGEPVIERYFDTKDLSGMTGMSVSSLERLLHWVKTEHPGPATDFILDDPKEGYMVLQDVFIEFQKQNRRFDKFLKALVTGRATTSQGEPESE